MLAILKRAPDTDDPVAAEVLVALSIPTVTSAALVPSLPFAQTNLSPLSVVEKVTELPDPDVYLN